MKITLAVLLAWLTTIYCNSSAVLSLPPSLIINAAASLRHQQQQQQQGPTAASLFPISSSPFLSLLNTKERIPRWKKDTEYFAGGGGGGDGERVSDETDAVRHNIFDGIVRPIQDNVNRHNHESREHYNYNMPAISATAERDYQQQQQHSLNLKRKLASGEYDLNTLLPTPLLPQPQTSDETSNELPQQSAAATKTADLLQSQKNVAPRMHGKKLNELFTPLKYWARHCQPGKNCPQEYYRALLNGRNQAAAAAATEARRRQQMEREAFFNDDNSNNNNNYNDDYDVKHATADGNINIDDDDDDDANDNSNNKNNNDNTMLNDADAAANNDVLMLLTGEQDVMKFLNWAMAQLYPYQKFKNFTENDSGADYYHPGMYIWKKLNLSGRLEPPLLVEEPHYVIVRREQLQEDLQSGSQYRGDPFIPPRGRKHNLPDLDALMQRYETFVPNRGRRDRIKDIFKYDDLFYPNRGKKQKPPKATTLAVLMDNECKEDDGGGGIYGSAVGQKEIEGENIMVNDVFIPDENAFDDDSGGDNDNNLTAPPSTIARRRMLGNLKRRLRQQKRCLVQQVAGNKNQQQQQQKPQKTATMKYAPATITNEIIDNDNNYNNEWWLHKMPMYKINEYDQSVKSSMPAAQAPAAAIATQAIEEMSSPKATNNALQQQRSEEPLQQKQQQQHQWHTTFMNTRFRRVAGTFAGAARVAANRLHSTRSMSQQSQHHQHQQQLLQQQQQQYHQQQPLRYRQISLPESSSQYKPQQQRRERERQQTQQQQQLQRQPQHKVKSLTDLDLLLWRQLQLLQQQNLLTTLQQPQLTSSLQQRQHLQHQLQQFPQQQPQETQLADVAAAGAATADDIDYIYSNI